MREGEHPVDKAIRVLNEALQADPVGINVLMSMEVEINDALRDHPTIQVGQSIIDPVDGVCVLRPIGLINALFGTTHDEWGFICMVVDEDGAITEFKRLEGHDA